MKIKNPFEVHTIQFHLSLYQLNLLIQVLQQSSPSNTDENITFQLYQELTRIKEEIESS